jgi:hypothetical protein
MSDNDNEAGGFWDLILATQLEASDFGVVCLTPANLESRWMNFQAGALSKAMTDARVVPLLFQLKDPDVGLPLSRFQMKTVSREGILDTIKAINANADPDRKVAEDTLIGTFESLWPKLKAQLDAVPAGPEPRQRTQRELLEEILDLTRDLAREGSDGHAGSSISTPHAPTYLSVQGSAHIEEISPTKGVIDSLINIAGPEGSVIITGNSQIRTINFRSPHALNRPDRIALEAAAEKLRRHGIRFVAQAPYMGEPD